MTPFHILLALAALLVLISLFPQSNSWPLVSVAVLLVIGAVWVGR